MPQIRPITDLLTGISALPLSEEKKRNICQLRIPTAAGRKLHGNLPDRRGEKAGYCRNHALSPSSF